MPARFSAAELTEFWLRAVDPTRVGATAAIASELAGYTGEPIDVVLQKMKSGGDDFNELWRHSSVDVGDEKSIASFYKDQFIEAYELANWHAGQTYGSFPLNYAKAALHAKARGLKRALDFGSGIGSGSIALAMAGCEVHSADVANRLLDFVTHRLRSRGFRAHPIDLGHGQAPPRRYFDLITCFDVLEHVPDQLSKVRELIGYLRPGGYLFVNFYANPIGDDHAMHVSGAGDWLRLTRKTPLVPEWASFDGEMQMLRLRPGGRLYNAAAAIKDRIQGFTG